MAFRPITLNTPAEDPAHILAEDDAALYESLIGSDKVLNIGGKLAATTISNNKIRISDGVVVVGGHVGRICKGDYEDMTIENGTSGQNRNDLIVARFIAGSSGGADYYGLAVIKGTPGITATDPVFLQGNLYDGDPQRDFPLYRAKLEGLSIVAVEPMFEVSQTIGELEETVKALNDKSIIESGSNANGNWRKWADGTIEQWGVKQANYLCDDVAGSGYFSTRIRIVFPVKFSFNFEVNANLLKSSASADFIILEGNNDVSGFSIYVAALYKQTQARSGYFHWRAIGK